MKKLFSFTILFSVLCSLFFISAPKALADSYGSYGGGGTPTDLTINKLVKNPVSNVYVENLGSTDATFSPEATASFKLVVKNGSGETMHPVTVTDQLPTYLTFVSANVPSKTNNDENSVVFTLDTMIAGETRTIEFTAKIAPRASFATGRSMFCVSNYTKVTAPARPNGDDDTAEFCITAGVENLPTAGVNDLFAMIPFLSLGGIGTFLLGKKQK